MVGPGRDDPPRLNTRTQEGRTFVTLYDVPVEELERLIQALRAGVDAQPVTLRGQKRAA